MKRVSFQTPPARISDMTPTGPDRSHTQINTPLTKSRPRATSRTHLNCGIECKRKRLISRWKIGLLLSIERGEDAGQTEQQMFFLSYLFVILCWSQETEKTTILALDFKGSVISGRDGCSK